MKNKVTYFKLAVFLGIICKLYDDIVDNNLYGHFSISNDNKPFFNEIMKGLFIIGYTTISIEYPFFMITFTAINAMLYFNCKDDFNSYDFSSFVSPIILIPFMNWNEANVYYKNIILLLLILSIVVLTEIVRYGKENIEYSNKKMVTRLILLGLLICIIPFSSSMHITTDILQLFYFGIGYLFMSCISQYCLLNGIWESDDTNKSEYKVEYNNSESISDDTNKSEYKVESTDS